MTGQFVRFLIVGASNTAVTWLLFLALATWSGLRLAVANLIAWSAGTIWSFWWNRRFTFSVRGRADLLQAVRFMAVAVGAIGISTAIVDRLEASGPIVAQAAATAVGLAWNFTLYRMVVFRSPPARRRCSEP